MVNSERYVLHPGYVVSKYDGQKHFISAMHLSSLYGISLRECVIAGRRDFIGKDGDIHLHPRADGNYALPTT